MGKVRIRVTISIKVSVSGYLGLKTTKERLMTNES